MAPCNETLDHLSVAGEVKYSYGLTFHHVGLIICAVFGLIAISVASYLMLMHATHYLKPWEQKHIIRILFMIPIYALVSFLSYLYYKHAIYFEVLRDCYEAFAIASFFTLLCNYVAPNIREQKEHFRTVKPKNWVLPINWFQKCSGGADRGPFRRPQSGLTWFNICWVGVFQYCFIRVLFTIVSVASEAGNRYCEASLNPQFAHIWVLCFEGASVSVAMYCLIQFYYQLKEEIAEHRPLLKILCIKLVIFFSFWQSLLISFVSSANGPLRPTDHIAYPDIKVGIPSMLLCLEMAIFSVMHIWAFPWRKTYSLNSASNNISSGPYTYPTPAEAAPAYQGGKLGLRAFADAFNPWDIVKACGRAFRWLFVGVRHRHTDSSYAGKNSSLARNSLGQGAKIIARPEDAWPIRPDDDAKVAMQPLSSSGHHLTMPEVRVGVAEGEAGAGYAGHPHNLESGHLNPYHAYPPYPSPSLGSDGSSARNPFDEDTGYHPHAPLRSQEDVNEYVRAGDPFRDHRKSEEDAGRGLLR